MSGLVSDVFTVGARSRDIVLVFRCLRCVLLYDAATMLLICPRNIVLFALLVVIR